MVEREFNAVTRIAVAVSFDERLHALVRFALRAGASVKLIHVCDHWNQSALIAPSTSPQTRTLAIL